MPLDVRGGGVQVVFRDGEREAVAPYAEEARVRIRQMAQRVPEPVRRDSLALTDMLCGPPNVDVTRWSYWHARDDV